jgi:hypothetical protein
VALSTSPTEVLSAATVSVDSLPPVSGICKQCDRNAERGFLAYKHKLRKTFALLANALPELVFMAKNYTPTRDF